MVAAPGTRRQAALPPDKSECEVQWYLPIHSAHESGRYVARCLLKRKSNRFVFIEIHQEIEYDNHNETERNLHCRRKGERGYEKEE